ncbi:MAG: hypothetical protein LBV20_06610 [Treponema sp.]|jgi:hypothetical protein|nr:hypothetical protein [Treponema sp.]
MKLPENHLTAEQEKIWEKTLKDLTALYEKLNLTAKPMPADKIKMARVPGNIAEESYIPLPWDVQLLLGFDQNLTLAPDDNEFPLLGDASKGVVCNTDVLIELISDLSGEEPSSRKGRKIFLEQAGNLSPLIDLPQLDGDELPMLWPVLSRDQCSIVLHLNTDENAEFYVRSTSLFSYVLQYLASAADLPETIEDTKTDKSQLWTEKKDQIILDRVEPKLELLNDSLANMAETMFHKKKNMYNFGEDDDDENEDQYENGSYDDEDDGDSYSDSDDDYFDDDEYDDDDEYGDDDEYDDEEDYDFDDEGYDEDM